MQISEPARGAAWPPTRAAALERLAAFAPRAGRVYAAERNYDRGPQQRTNVSTLSPYLRSRALTEVEVLTAVRARFSLASAEKFVQEVFWRTYWKGWLQAHPSAWSRYVAGCTQRFAELAADAEAAAAYSRAVNGATGIDVFNAWVHELVAHNYLHNHARMWFAGIWIFTLGLPWELGADFFLRHLLDGDPAANTLSWRWVAGLHTRGKAYLPSADNIRRYTEGRFAPNAPLARSVQPLEDPAIPLVRPDPVPLEAPPRQPSLLILHEDDLHGDLGELPAIPIVGVCAIRTAAGRSAQALSPAVVAFADALAAEAVGRAAAHLGARDLGVVDATEPAARGAAVDGAAGACGAVRLVTPFAPVGPARAALDALAHASALPYAEFGRRYDAVSWPAATRGFFNLRSRIPTILSELGIGAG